MSTQAWTWHQALDVPSPEWDNAPKCQRAACFAATNAHRLDFTTYGEGLTLGPSTSQVAEKGQAMETTNDQITRIVASGESQTVEFKTSLSERKEGLKSLCGMLNSDIGHGLVMFGVKDDGLLCGVKSDNLDSNQLKLSQHVSQKFEPPITPTIEVVSVESASILLIRANRCRSVPYHEYDGRAYIRVGTETKTLSFEEKDALRKQRDRNGHNGPWQCDRCGTQVGLLVNNVSAADGMHKSYKCSCGGEFWPT